jgi:hypothetical protein
MRGADVRRGAVVGLAVLGLIGSVPASGGGGVLGAIGRLVGRPAGGFVEAVSKPTLDNVEASGHRLVEDVDQRLEARIEQADDAVQEALDDADRVIEARIGQVDVVMAARISQIDASASILVERSLGELDVISRARIEEATAGAQAVVRDLDDAGRKRIEQADQVLEARIAQVDGMVEQAIHRADAAAAARIEQLDLVAERRLGNLDVIASKQTLLVEGSLLKVAALAAMLAFLVLGIWPVLRDAQLPWTELRLARTMGARARVVLGLVRASAAWCAIRIAGVVAVAAILFGLSRTLPLGSAEAIDRLTAMHEEAQRRGLDAFDLAGVQYHTAQLAILDPRRQHCHRGVLLKAELLSDVFARGGWSFREEGLRAVSDDLARLEWAADPACGAGPSDPDVLVAQAHVLWQAAADRAVELEAAQLCAQALTGPDGADFRLRGLALHYLRAFLWDAPPGMDREVAELRAADDPDALADFRPLQASLAFDRLAASLSESASDAYVALLDAQARVESASGSEVTEALRVRAGAAEAVISAWRAFDAGLVGDPAIAGSRSVAMGALALDDAPLSQALWYAASPADVGRAPRAREVADAGLRARIAPVRIAWARRYLGPLGETTRRVVGFEEARRYLAFEDRAAAFQAAYVEWRKAGDDATPARAQAAACGAARMGLYVGTGAERRPVVEAMGVDGDTDCGEVSVDWLYLRR